MIPRVIIVALAFAVSVVAPSRAQTVDQSVEMVRVELVGRELYDHDRAAWLSTDAMMADLGESARANVAGWVTEADGNTIVVTFSAANRRDSIYRAVYGHGELLAHEAQSVPLTPVQVHLLQARDAAMATLVVPCSSRYNTVTLPSSNAGDVDVYLMPGTTDANQVIVGGYHRVRVNVSGVVTETQPFSRSCLTLSRANPQFQNGQAAALYFTHIVSPLPTETHVFINLVQRLPLLVGTSTGVWQVADGHVTLAQEARQ